MKPVNPVQMNIYQSSTNKKDLSWLHFDNEPGLQERQQMKDQQSYVSISVAYLTIPSTSQEPLNLTTVFHAYPYGEFIEIQGRFT